MSAKLEFIINLIDICAFFLVTPEVLGIDRIQAIFSKFSNIIIWIRSVWFSRDDFPFNLSNLASLIIVLILTALFLVGVKLPHLLSVNPVMLTLIPVTLFTFIPVSFVILFWIISGLEKRVQINRAMAILGACLFISGRVMALVDAYSRF